MNYKIGATGFEPAIDLEPSNHEHCGYADCEMCRAANALHSGCFQWLESALNDAYLQQVIATWSDMPEAIRIAIMALVRTTPAWATASGGNSRIQSSVSETA